ncbi:pentapeptide repeat-containing protein [Motiliproteus sp. MSK22-1]|uniref:pentapeptide repeat-containing protein n=1 Tax=Motiliproteus sp. MSK22-1 TaxID=1897630 RepID=UPI0009782004|nr:pentapeptide repeat-containing protein [Motiliproteus sp. MSK22-1]OMH38031.1 hypothetical protein BGP75_07035 [Motiliproteus sp. MSK22-1]
MVNFEAGEKEYLSKNFNSLDFSKAEICYKEFDGCTFKNCDFSEAIFRKCAFMDCSFEKCNLSVVKLEYSKFSNVFFDECKVIGVDWTKATWPDIALHSSIKFNRCIINDSSFFGLSLQQIVIEDCKAEDVDFREGDFSDAIFTYTNFSNSLFNKTNLTGSDFTEATDYNINIYDNEVKGARFCRYEAASLLHSLGIELVD